MMNAPGFEHLSSTRSADEPETRPMPIAPECPRLLLERPVGSRSTTSGRRLPGRRSVFMRRRAALLAALVSVSVLAGACTSAATPSPTPGSAAPSSATDPYASGVACPTSQPAPLPAGQKRKVTIETPKGSIVITVDGALSPIAAGNFLSLAACGFYNDVVFHRVVPGFVIQGGDGQYGKATNIDRQLVGSGGPGYTIQDEPVTATYGRGTVAMARSSQPNSQGSQFFIVLDDSARTALAQYNTYAIFGTVTKGMDTADAIAKAADAEMPSDPIPMTKVTVSAP